MAVLFCQHRCGGCLGLSTWMSPCLCAWVDSRECTAENISDAVKMSFPGKSLAHCILCQGCLALMLGAWNHTVWQINPVFCFRRKLLAGGGGGGRDDSLCCGYSVLRFILFFWWISFWPGSLSLPRCFWLGLEILMLGRLKKRHLTFFSFLQTHTSMCSFQNDSRNFNSQINYIMKTENQLGLFCWKVGVLCPVSPQGNYHKKLKMLLSIFWSW